MTTQPAIFTVIVPGWNFFIEKFAEEFLKVTGLPSLGHQRSGVQFEDFKEDIGKLLDHFDVLLDCVRKGILPGKDMAANKTSGDYLAEQPLRIELFRALAPNFSEPRPIFLDRQTLLVRCRQKEQAIHSYKNRPINDPMRQWAEKCKVAYQLFGHTPGDLPGEGKLDEKNHGFEFSLFLHILGYLLANRPWFALAAQTGSFPAGVRETLVATAKERGFGDEAAQILPELGKELVKPVKYDVDPVLNFRCESVSGGIVKLKWSIPTGPGIRCDKVTLERRPSAAGSSWTQILRRERVEQCYDDHSHERGEGFFYRTRSYYSGSEADLGPEIFVAIPDDPRIETARWINGKVEMIYSPAKNTLETIVYRRQGAKPQFKTSDGTPLDAETEVVARDANTRRCEDKSVQGGKSYWYTLATEYTGGIRTFSTSVEVAIPSPPGLPGTVSAEFKFNTETGEVTVLVRLQTSGSPVEFKYLVERFEWASGSPLTPTKKLLTPEPVPDKSWIDREVEVARQYVYRVRAVREGVEGPPSQSRVVSITPGLVGLEAEPADRAIEVHYQENKIAKQVIVSLGEGRNRPVSPAEGQRVFSGPVSARASGLINGQSYNISVFCLYELPGGESAWSRQEILSVVPRVKPEAVAITARVEEGKIVCGFTDPRAGSVKVIRLADAPAYRRNDKLDLSLVEKLGIEIPVSGRQAIDSKPDPRQPYYLALTLDDLLRKAIVGTYCKYVLVPEIEDLRCYPLDAAVRLTWKWSECCSQAIVLWKDGGYPDPPKVEQIPDGKTEWKCGGQLIPLIERRAYEREGDSFEITLDPTSGDWHVRVWAAVGDSLSECKSDDCQLRIPRRARTVLEYHAHRQERDLILKWRLHPPSDEPVEFFVRATKDEPPVYPTDGQQMFPPAQTTTWPTQGPDGYHIWKTPYPFGADSCYVRLFLAPSVRMREWVAIRHPDNILSPVDGRSSGDTAAVPQIVFTRPRIIRCTYCFDNFAWWSMHLREEETGKERKLALWRRVLARLYLPKAAPEAVLVGPIKVCPMHCEEQRRVHHRVTTLDNELFRSPGVQLGLVGTVAVGKSHWVYSIYRRMGLTIVDENTFERYARMEERVEKERAPLDRTQQPDEKTIVPPYLFIASCAKGRFLVSLCDVDGEIWGAFGKAGMLRYLWASNALVFIIDPLQIDSVRELLEANGAIPEDVPIAKEDQRRALTNLDTGFRQRYGGKYPIPIAVVISKGDLLWSVDPALKETLRAAPIFHPRTKDRYDMTVHWRTQFAVREFLMRHEPWIVSQVESKFSSYAYFCVSATGSSAKTENGQSRFSRFAPWRIEEPVLWCFSQLGIIPKM